MAAALAFATNTTGVALDQPHMETVVARVAPLILAKTAEPRQRRSAWLSGQTFGASKMPELGARVRRPEKRKCLDREAEIRKKCPGRDRPF